MLTEYIEERIAAYEILKIECRKVPEYVLACNTVIEELKNLLIWSGYGMSEIESFISPD